MGNPRRQSRFAYVTADTACAGKQPVFGHHRRHWRQVNDLMPDIQAGDLDRAAAGGARTGPAIVRVRDLFGRQQCPCLAGMAGLGAAFLATGRLPFLRGRAMGIGRGRRGGVARVGMQPFFEGLDALVQRIDLSCLLLELAGLRLRQYPQGIDERLRLFQVMYTRGRLRQVDVHAHESRRTAFRLRASHTNALSIAAGQHFGARTLTPAISWRGERILQNQGELTSPTPGSESSVKLLRDLEGP